MKWLGDMKIGTKILAGYLGIALITAVLGYISTDSLRSLLAAARSTYVYSTEPLGGAGRVGIVVQRSRVNLRGMLLDDSQERREANAATIRKNDTVIDQEMSRLDKALKMDVLRKEFEKLRGSIASYRPVREKIVALALSGERDAALELMRSEGLAFEKEIDASVGRLLDLQVKGAKDDVEDNAAAGTRTFTINVILVLVGIVGAVIMGIVLSRIITGPLRKVVDVAEAIADGDLTRSLHVNRNDETGKLAAAMNGMTEKLRSIMTLLSDRSAKVAVTAEKLTDTSSQMAAGTEEVASQTGTLAAASEEMAATSTEIASNCGSVADGARKASDSALHGSSIVNETVAGMERIARRVKDSSATIARLGDSSDRIGAIIGTIEDIADQTNLLALNAAIEAARAGDQGRGFAVVADEVRALAERTSRATREISAMIKGIQQETRDAVKSMEEGVNEVVAGTEDAGKSLAALEEISRMIDAVTSQVGQIATAAEEQTATTGEIARNIQDITQVIDGTSRGAHDLAAEASEMAQLAQELRKVVEQFRLVA